MSPLLVVVVALVSLPALAGECPLVRRTKPMMGTYVAISARACDAEKTESAIRAAFDEMQRLADQLSEWNPKSAVSAVSRNAGVAPVPVPPELFEVLSVAKAASRATNGAFDVTWAALAGLWHFEGSVDGSNAVPDPEAVRRQAALVGDRDLLLDPAARTAFLRRAGMRLGLGGLAKGDIAQAGADLLVARGVPDVLVAASGDITARGRNGERPWSIGIQDPRRSRQLVATVELHDESVSTAGDYEHAFFKGGKRYHHILNPKTGMPAEGAASVSVLSKRGVWADALDTGLLILGLNGGAAAADRLADVGVLLVDDGGRLRQAGPFGSRFQVGPQSASERADSSLRR